MVLDNTNNQFGRLRADCKWIDQLGAVCRLFGVSNGQDACETISAASEAARAALVSSCDTGRLTQHSYA